jgi:hypothetical protein
MQEGSVIREHRKLGPDVWSYRWWESGSNGNRVHRRIVLGTAEQIRELRNWRRRTLYRTPESWVFGSPQTRGKNPYWGRELLRHYIRPVAQEPGITKRIGWHTFRRTYSTPAPRYWGRAQGYAGTDAAFNDPRHSGHLHPGRH